MIPYKEEKISEYNTIRKFSSNTDDLEFKWHRDGEDRLIKIIKSNGWYFQFDNDVPFEMIDDHIFSIKKGQWHRIIKGKGELIIDIVKK